MASTMIVLSVPPKGKSVDIEFAERCNKGANNRMKNRLTDIDRMQQRTVLQLRRESQNLKKELADIRKKSPVTKELRTPEFLKQEKQRIQQKAGYSRKSDYRSDGNSSDEYSELSYDGSEDSNDGETKFRRQKVATLEERSREKTFSNLHRRFSAQLKTNIRS